MLNSAQTGAIEAIRERGPTRSATSGIGTLTYPDVFVASAMANVSLGSLLAAKDLAEGEWQPGVVRKIGIENPDAVSVALAPGVPDEVREKIADLAEDIKSGKIEVSVEYEGEEFQF